MVKWRFLSFLVVLVLMSKLTGCGESHDGFGYSKADPYPMVVAEDVYPSEDEADEVEPVDETEPTPVVEPNEEWGKPTPGAEAAEIEEAELTWTDHNGYTFKATYGLSDWIADEQVLKATWDSISNGKPQPDFSENMPIGDLMKYNGRVCGHETNEIRYLVGYFRVENTTSGFAITETNPAEIIIELFTNTPYAMMQTSSNDIFLPHGTTTVDITTDGLYKGEGEGLFGRGIHYVMKSDRLRASFIIALSISSTPNEPEGTPDPAQIAVTARCYDWNSGECSEHIFVPKTVEP